MMRLRIAPRKRAMIGAAIITTSANWEPALAAAGKFTTYSIELFHFTAWLAGFRLEVWKSPYVRTHKSLLKSTKIKQPRSDHDRVICAANCAGTRAETRYGTRSETSSHEAWYWQDPALLELQSTQLGHKKRTCPKTKKVASKTTRSTWRRN